MEFKRLRRLRQTKALRELFYETRLYSKEFIFPLFIDDGNNVFERMPQLDGIVKVSVDRLQEALDEIKKADIGGVILFGVTSQKDEMGSYATRDDGAVQQAIRKIKEYSEDILVFADVCLCEYTSHGHCGILKGDKIDNDKTIEVLSEIALSYAKAGADIICPSDMMDGRVAAIRKKLDSHGFVYTPIIPYSAKFASSLYAPFRDVANSRPAFGDRKSYQMPYQNKREALREIEADISEGADAVIIKPALTSLDVISAAKEKFNIPIIAYNVSGEYAMVKSAGKLGLLNEEEVIIEILTAIKRAGADAIITYHALEAARILNGKEL
ncbi:porphobilinogen synthase [Caldicellulosiruptor changbaiensis]|uniref:Delta-aminolevulinic acid dehydratase n=1 Tax=Caldicellulosiruptor changbaiensis TaxID=1222016 RepID=A0A3T0D6C8_9FIRM|nr:porphobilinogen synthase [Caldicellulosiruptor changbaiensis]AZT90604.1 porphobilinogen synthase [Caldicellulosiruptor changbaiensis]